MLQARCFPPAAIRIVSPGLQGDGNETTSYICPNQSTQHRMQLHKPCSGDSRLNAGENSRLGQARGGAIHSQPEPGVARQVFPSAASEGGVIPICKPNSNSWQKQDKLAPHISLISTAKKGGFDLNSPQWTLQNTDKTHIYQNYESPWTKLMHLLKKHQNSITPLQKSRIII